jgi:hypothetical protein
MAIPGLFIEYLVNGAVALIWLVPLLTSTGFGKVESAYLALYALGLYVLGMMIDFIAWTVTRPIKHFLRRKISAKYHLSPSTAPGTSIERQVKFALYARDLHNEISMRSSRDRIARGAFLNAVIATVVILPLATGVPLIVLTFAVWLGSESISYKFELKAEQALDEKIAMGNK